MSLLYDFDNNLRKEYNVSLISGSDEVGRGAMAGPIVVATVILKPDFFDNRINDSKLLSYKVREELYNIIVDNSVSYKICTYDSAFVDINNPKETSKIGMQDSIKGLDTKPELVLLDAEKISLDASYKTISLIKGDSRSISIAAASIIAKVYRDRILIEYDSLYPGYGFKEHKGYCTKIHKKAVSELGVLPIHRKSYKPIKELLEGN